MGQGFRRAAENRTPAAGAPRAAAPHSTSTSEFGLNGQTIGTFNSIMSSSGSRNTDFLFEQQVSGVTVGDTLAFTFNGLQNLGSSWANIDILRHRLT